MKKCSPLGKREGAGTFDQIWDLDKYKSLEEAVKANDSVIIDFVKDDEGFKHFELYHTKKPEDKTHYRLQIQHFPFGIDIMDDRNAIKLANHILNINSNQD